MYLLTVLSFECGSVLQSRMQTCSTLQVFLTHESRVLGIALMNNTASCVVTLLVLAVSLSPYEIQCVASAACPVHALQDAAVCKPQGIKCRPDVMQPTSATPACKHPSASAEAEAKLWQHANDPDLIKLMPVVSEPQLDSASCLGQAVQPSMPYEVGLSGPPLPPCHEAR